MIKRNCLRTGIAGKQRSRRTSDVKAFTADNINPRHLCDKYLLPTHEGEMRNKTDLGSGGLRDYFVLAQEIGVVFLIKQLSALPFKLGRKFVVGVNVQHKSLLQ